MNNKKFGLMLTFVSFLTSLFVYMGLAGLCEDIDSSSPLLRAAAVGAALAAAPLAAFIAMHISAVLRKRVKVQLPKLLSIAAFFTVILAFAVGFGGQILYSMKINKETKKAEDINSDIVLMLDDSGSMKNYYDDVRNASIAFVEKLPESSRAAAGIFAYKVGAFEDLTQMDMNGKKRIRDFLLSNNFGGGTNFDAALEKAYSCLMAKKDENTNRAVVFITDGIDIISQKIRNDYINDNIKLYTIRLTNDSTGMAKDLVDFAIQTGGADTIVTVNGSNVTGLDEMLKAFETITSSLETEKKLDFNEGMILYDDSVSVYGVIIRTVVFLIIIMLVQILYFRKLSAGNMAGDILTAAAASAVVTAAGEMSLFVLSAVSAAAFMYTAYVKLEIRNGGTNDV